MKRSIRPKNQKSNKNKSRKRISSTLSLPEKLKRLNKKNGKSIFKGLLVSCLILFLLGCIVVVGMFAYFSQNLPNPNRLIDRNIQQSTKIYDRTGKHLLWEIHGDQKRTIVKLENIPDYATKALISIEDKDFYNNKFGISVRRTMKSIIYYGLEKITNGRISGPGGSGLTQQLVKNAILGSERSVTRKMKEWILTVQIERKFTKEEILQMYFNEIPYGSTSYGIESASKYYFNKSAINLTLGESAILAAIINRPTYYSPYGNNKEELFERQQLVLWLMEQQGYITEEEFEIAKQEEIVFKSNVEKIEAPHFVFYVRELLTEMYDEKLIEEGGLEVITTLDFEKQKFAEDLLYNKKELLKENFDATNASLVAMDPKNGDILTMVGSIDYFDNENDGQVNVSLRPRQPGSSFKPIVFTTAFEKGYTPETMFYDVETLFKTETGEDYIPHNYDLKERGLVSMKKSLAGSLNITAVKTMYLTGVNIVLDKIDLLGYTTFVDRSRFGFSLVLGGGEVKLLEHVNAYSALANHGILAKSRAILSVKSPDGLINDEFEIEKRRVWEESAVNSVNDILSDIDARAYVFGNNTNLFLENKTSGVKTGTTNDYRDAWTVGFTPSLVTGVWVGNNDNSKMKEGTAGGSVAAPIWDDFMEEALKDKEDEPFGKNEKIVTDKKILKGEVSEMQIVKVDKISGKLATDLTPSSQIEERVYAASHSILHYVDKDDPLGPYPSNPSLADSAYDLWEDGIKQWMQKKQEENDETDNLDEKEKIKELCKDNSDSEDCEKIKIYLDAPPIEEDDVHILGNLPELSIVYPNDFANLVVNNQTFKVTASSPLNNIKRVEYLLDGVNIGVVTTKPYSLDYSLADISNGFYTLEVIVYDEFENQAGDTVTIQVNTVKLPLTVMWMGPKIDTSFSYDDFPKKLVLYIKRYKEVSKVNFYYYNSGFQKILINSIKEPSSTLVSVDWENSPGTGNYSLIAEVQTIDGIIVNSGQINVNIN